MPAQTTQATLAAISVRVRNMEETLREILSRVSVGGASTSQTPTPPPK